MSKHRTKTTLLKEKKNVVPKLPITPFSPPHSDEPLSFARQRRKFFIGKTRRKITLFFVMNKSAFMIFASQNRRAVRSAPLINSIFPAIIIPEHRAKTPRTEKEKKKNWSSCSPKRRSHPLTLMTLFLLRGSADFFDFTLPWAAGEGGEGARGSVGPPN